MSETIIAPGIYAIKNAQTSNYIVSRSTDTPESVVRTAKKDETGTLPAFNFEIKPINFGGYSVTSLLTGLHIGIAQPADGTPVEWAPSYAPQAIGFIHNDGRYVIRLPPSQLPVERYAYEKIGAHEVAVTRSLNEAGTEWVLERVLLD
ncbi:hypothetical protein D9757_001541 [Collybiopsis confluens]|uniref:Uncharacterized protein n=1 Tax=Collybiopsis confluens TaxID=2823264 RepID=A0A8H5MG18_9AGAR|nr:hypothetical protein D9757_001541 [Collybiopsis confluens]